MAYVDLHIHSRYSDGSYTPEEIVRIAKGSDCGLISVCDHNLIRGTLETGPIALAAGLKYIPGVEIDAIFENTDIHILCYGADLENEALLREIRHARMMLDTMSSDLLERMIPDYPQLSTAEYDAFTHDWHRGGWKMLQYLQAKGVTPDMKSGFPLYDDYGVTYQAAGFHSAETVIAAIHGAGGRAVLAHPGVVFPTEDLREFEKILNRALDLGLDGVECYYVRHSEGVTRRCLEVCSARGLLVTAGSDCHGAFNSNQIGQTRTPEALCNI